MDDPKFLSRDKPRFTRKLGQGGFIKQLAKSGAGTLNKHGRGHSPKKARNRKGR